MIFKKRLIPLLSVALIPLAFAKFPIFPTSKLAEINSEQLEATHKNIEAFDSFIEENEDIVNILEATEKIHTGLEIINEALPALEAFPEIAPEVMELHETLEVALKATKPVVIAGAVTAKALDVIIKAISLAETPLKNANKNMTLRSPQIYKLVGAISKLLSCKKSVESRVYVETELFKVNSLLGELNRTSDALYKETVEYKSKMKPYTETGNILKAMTLDSHKTLDRVGKMAKKVNDFIPNIKFIQVELGKTITLVFPEPTFKKYPHIKKHKFKFKVKTLLKGPAEVEKFLMKIGEAALIAELKSFGVSDFAIKAVRKYAKKEKKIITDKLSLKLLPFPSDKLDTITHSAKKGKDLMDNVMNISKITTKVTIDPNAFKSCSELTKRF